jgi:WD40 repeat protein
VWNADESRILTASDDHTAREWDVGTRNELVTLSGHTGAVWQAVWSADEGRILIASDDGTVRQWSYTRMEDLLKAACQRAPRNMTRGEWHRFMSDEAYRETCPNKPVPDWDN